MNEIESDSSDPAANLRELVSPSSSGPGISLALQQRLSLPAGAAPVAPVRAFDLQLFSPITSPRLSPARLHLGQSRPRSISGAVDDLVSAQRVRYDGASGSGLNTSPALTEHISSVSHFLVAAEIASEIVAASAPPAPAFQYGEISPADFVPSAPPVPAASAPSYSHVLQYTAAPFAAPLPASLRYSQASQHNHDCEGDALINETIHHLTAGDPDFRRYLSVFLSEWYWFTGGEE